jgi:hypothetical protein
MRLRATVSVTYDVASATDAIRTFDEQSLREDPIGFLQVFSVDDLECKVEIAQEVA